MTKQDAQAALKRNELDANRQMIWSCLFTGGLILLIWIGYLFHWFPLKSYLLVHIFFPINIGLLVSSYFWGKTPFIKKPGFKYFLLGLLIYVAAVVNILVPKHGVLAWAVPLALAAHYYSRRVSLIIFGICMSLMLGCMYAGMFVGEYDANLLTAGRVVCDAENVCKVVEVQGVAERYKFLQELAASGENRYWKVFIYYYLSRAVALTILFFAIQSLSLRTGRLVVQEFFVKQEKEKMDKELQIASDIQLSALPSPTFQNEEVNIFATIVPARQVGGDFYDYLFLDKRHVGLLIGDVSGKGMPAALFMMKAITAFRDTIDLDKPLDETMHEVNERLLKGNASSLFVTALIAVLDLRSGELRYCNAGHCHPLVRSRGKFNFLDCQSGFILGVSPTASWKEERTHLFPGDIFALYTDGITEAKNDRNENYGNIRLLRACYGIDFKTLNEFHREIDDSIKSFVQGHEQSDDITALTLQYMPEAVSWKEKVIDGKLEEVKTAISFVEKNAEKDNIDKSFTKKLLVAVDEIFSNIAKYAYGENKETGTVFMRYSYALKTKELSITFVDKGVAFDPTEAKSPDTSLSAEERPIGGLGIMLVKKIMDEVEYDRRNDKNFLVLVKKFPADE